MKNPLRGLRFSLLDFGRVRSSMGMRLATIAICMIPLIYGALYLAAFYDPYGNIDRVPVAVVNEDEGYTREDGTRVTAGADVVEQLADSGALDFTFTDDATAQAGLEDGTFYMKLVIPEDFSRDVASADTDNPQRTELVLVGNESANSIATTMGTSAFRVITSKVNYAIGQDYYVEVFDAIGESAGQVKVAADGAMELADGLGEAQEGSQQITDGLGQAATGTGELENGLGTAQAGSAAISQNLALAADGAQALDDGMQQLVDGLATGQVGAAELASGLHQLQAQGTSQMAAGAAGLRAALDAGAGDFRALDSGAAQVAGGVGQMAEGLSGLSGQLGTMSAAVDGLEQQLDTVEEQATQLTEQLTAAGTKLQQDAKAAADDAAALAEATAQLSPALGQASTGLGEVSDGLDQVATAADNAATYAGQAQTALSGIRPTANDDGTYTINAAEYAQLQAATQAAGAAQQYASGAAQGASSAKDGVDEAKSGVDQIKGGVDAQASQTEQLTQHLEAVGQDLAAIQQGSQGLSAIVQASGQLIGGSRQLVEGAQQMLSGLSGQLSQLSALQAGAESVSAGVHALVTSLTSADPANPTSSIYGAASALAQGATTVDATLGQAAAGADQLAGGTTLLAQGAGSAQTGAAGLAGGLQQLSTGSSVLTNGLSSATTGATALRQGLDALASGSGTLTSALGTAADGSRELADGLAEGYDDAMEQTRNTDAKAEMMSEPVKLESERYTTVSNYGSGFAPYFIALGMWVGALMATFLVKPLNERLIQSGASPVVAAFAGLVPALIIAAIQAVLMAAVLQFGLKCDVAHPLAYYGLVLLAGVVFAAVTQMLVATLGFPGKFVSVVLLMLQLTSAAGTFPLETVPDFFQAVNPLLPMTYVVRALRVATTGVDLSLIGPNVLALLAFGGLSFAVTCLVARRRRLITLNDLHPLVDLEA